MRSEHVRGEFVILVAGAAEESASSAADEARILLVELLEALPPSAARSRSRDGVTRCERNLLYRLALEISGKG